MEQRKDIPWREGLYQVSNEWRVKSLKFWRERILRNSVWSWWYTFVKLCIPWTQKTASVHRMIMLAFVWPSMLEVNHKNGIKTDNRLENLEYCTPSENVKHSFRVLWHKSNFETNNPMFWKWKFWKDHHSSKIVYQYTKFNEFIRERDSARDAHRELSIDYNWIIQCCRWEYKLSWGFIWRYRDELPKCRADWVKQDLRGL
jgi:hypothetical protein